MKKITQISKTERKLITISRIIDQDRTLKLDENNNEYENYNFMHPTLSE